MSTLSTTPNPSSYHALISNVSWLFGLVVFLQQIWGPASIEHTLLTAVGSGLAVYLILAVGYAAARGVVLHGPQPDEAEASSETDADDSTETASEPTEAVPERQAA